MEIVGVRFRKAGKIYYFDPDGARIRVGSNVIVETARGVEFGEVEIGNREIAESEIVQPLKKVMRVATAEDMHQEEKNRNREKEAIVICADKIKKHNLGMKLVDVELTFDLNKIIFYFTADGRVDFRELVKELASIFRMRIELRQIGVRDEAKILNGIGICGRALCCATFLDEFQPVSIKMAKDQSLSLNPTKISGICGRLMCCLKYEEETYEHLNKRLPKEGDLVMTPDGKGNVLSVSVLRQIVKAAVSKKEGDEKTVNFYSVNEVKILESKRVRDKKEDIPAAELKKILD
ncbi:MAG: stage 0 sporulation family protein [Clostridiales bacterium]|nr:stage 0 sporulation family protein [Clostridiales bacterium]